ncbi:MAG: endolytic transglycosylase MltG [bacterium]
MTLVSVVVLLGVLAGGYPILRRVAGDVGSGTTPDYTGAGTGTVTVQVHAGDATPDIATTLKDHDVVASKQAFVAAAARSGRAQDFQPGFFRLRRHMAASQAVTLLLQPANRVIAKVTVKEGTTVLEVLDQLHTQLRLPATDLKAAAADVKNLGLPAVFGTPKSAEGFLYPQTYQFDPDVTASEALQAMAAQFTSETDGLDFGAHAKALGYSPYQVLIIASLIQRESKFAEDRAKVARVVLNRMKSDTPIQFDSSSVYGAELEGKDLRTITYKETSPYNLRIHPGLPPTPITNPEVGVMQAALNPPAGNWLYFVNRDAAGHLFFTNSYKAFLAASDTCRRNNWGCT